MYAQFYDYLVKTLLRSYLKQAGNKPGDRYYVIIDDKAVGDANSKELLLLSKQSTRYPRNSSLPGSMPLIIRVLLKNLIRRE